VSYAAALASGAVCASADKARDISVNGDVVGIASGIYPTRQNLTNAGGPVFSSPGVTFKCAGTPASNPCVFSAGFDIGSDWTTVDGITAYTTAHTGSAMSIYGPYQVTEGAQLEHVTVKNSKIWTLSAGSEALAAAHTTVTGAVLFITGVANTTIGPGNTIFGCCSADAMDLYHNGYVGNDNVTFVQNTILGSYGGCQLVPASVIPSGATCDGYGQDSTPTPCTFYGNYCEHDDGIMVGDCNTCTFKNNLWWNAGAQPWFIQGFGPNPDPNICNISLVGNAFAGNGSPAAGGAFVNIGSNGWGNYCGVTKILYNTFEVPVRFYLCGDCNASVRSWRAGSTAIIVGNLFLASPSFNFIGSGYTTLGDCTQGGLTNLTPTIDHNIFNGQDCSALSASNRTLASSTVALVQPNSFPFDLHLDLTAAPSQTPIDNGETTYCGAGKDADIDADGDARPLGAACDLGYHEAG
jgi:hypothetical protein